MSWAIVYDENLVARSLADGGNMPIPLVTLNLSSPQLILNVSSEFARPTWWLALRLSIFTEVAELPGSPLVEVLKSTRIPLNQSSLVEIPVEQYQARLTIPPWHRQLHIKIWQREAASDDRQLLTASSAGQNEFTLSFAPAQPESTELYINGIKATYGRDYRIEGDRLLYLDSMPLDATDEIEISYPP